MSERLIVTNPPPSLKAQLERLLAEACMRDGYALQASQTEVPRGTLYECQKRYVPQEDAA